MNLLLELNNKRNIDLIHFSDIDAKISDKNRFSYLRSK